MAQVRQVITLDQGEADAIRDTLIGRAVNPVLNELRNLFNGPIHPSAGDSEKNPRLLTSIKADAEITDRDIAAVRTALEQRAGMLRTLLKAFGEDMPQTREVLEAHDRAAEIAIQVEDQIKQNQ